MTAEARDLRELGTVLDEMAAAGHPDSAGDTRGRGSARRAGRRDSAS